jgi:peptide-methionine (S)-S-oxide reductase
LELAFQRVEGVEHTAVGYTQGKEPEPNYEQLCAGATGHTEAVMVYFNPEIVGYEHLVRVFLDRIDPTTVDGQGRDYGRQYRTGIYTHSKEQEEIARKLLTEASPKYTRPIATELRPAMPFWPAEAYHQHYLEKGGRFGTPQSAEKGCRDEIRCYG